MRSSIYLTLAVAALCITPAAASAQMEVGVDIDAVFPSGDLLDGDTGLGVAGRLGVVLPLPGLRLVPEVQVGYVQLGAPAFATGIDLNVVRATAGGRLGVGTLLRPSVFAHIGYGRLNVSDDDAFFESRAGMGEESALTWDAGLALDLTLLPLIDVGVHGAYNTLETDEALHWWTAGVHAALVF